MAGEIRRSCIICAVGTRGPLILQIHGVVAVGVETEGISLDLIFIRKVGHAAKGRC